VQRVADGNDLVAPLKRPLKQPRRRPARPSLIAVRTVIGYGSPKAGTNKVHGEALGAEALRRRRSSSASPRTRAFMCPTMRWPTGARLSIAARKLEAKWKAEFEGYAAANPELAAEFERTQKGELKAGWEKAIPSFAGQAAGHAQRRRSGDERDCRNCAGTVWRRGGSDLSTKTIFKPGESFHVTRRGATSSSACASLACARR
jgi:transketolase